jgi:hypothetical protein
MNEKIARIFDKKLDAPDDPCPEFDEMMELIGSMHVMIQLLDDISYRRKKEATDAILKYGVKAYVKNSKKTKPLEYIFGLRKAGSERLKWHDAYVLGKAKNEDMITADGRNSHKSHCELL